MSDGIRKGNLWKQILLFALPLAATTMLEQLFNSTDVIVVGRFASSNALAAVGSTSSVVNLYITIFTGLAIGANVLTAQNIGARNQAKVTQAVHTSLALALLSGLLMTLFGYFTAEPLLVAMGTPAEIMDLAVSYLRIYTLGSIFIMLYNFESAIMRANGDTKRPLYCLLFSGALNVVLNLFFVIGCGLSVAGVAIATVLANGVGALLLLHFLRSEKNMVQVRLSWVRLDMPMLREILRIGIPAAIQGAMFNAANVVIQTGFNQLGADIIAASTIGVNAEIFAFYLMNSFNQAAVTFNGQNFGAGNYARCRKSTRVAMILAEVISLGFVGLLLVFRVPFAALYTTSQTIIELAQVRLIYVLPFEVFNIMIEVYSGSLRGLGYSSVPAAMCAIFVCGVRLLWLFLVFPRYHTYFCLLVVYPISWILTSGALAVCYYSIRRKVLPLKTVEA